MNQLRPSTGILLNPIVGAIVSESYQRVLAPVSIDPVLPIITTTDGLLVNLGAVDIVQRNEMESRRARGIRPPAWGHWWVDTVFVTTSVVAVFNLAVTDSDTAAFILSTRSHSRSR